MDHNWTKDAAEQFANLVARYGTSSVRNALALATSLSEEDFAATLVADHGWAKGDVEELVELATLYGLAVMENAL